MTTRRTSVIILVKDPDPTSGSPHAASCCWALVYKAQTVTLHRLDSFSPLAMSLAGPSRPRPVFGTIDRNNYEEDLTRMITQLDFSDVERLQASYGARVRQGQALSDHEIAFVLLMQNARELADLDADRAVAQRLALEELEGEEPDPAPR